MRSARQIAKERTIVFHPAYFQPPYALRTRRLTIPPAAEKVPGGMDARGRDHFYALRRWQRSLLRASITVAERADAASAAGSRDVGTVLVLQRLPSRGTRPGRAILNHDELVLALRRVFRERQVRTFPPEARPILEQARIWNRAHLVVAPHGAGLSNMLFMPDEARVLELKRWRAKGPWRIYSGLAEQLHLRYGGCSFQVGDVASHAFPRLPLPTPSHAFPRLPTLTHPADAPSRWATWPTASTSSSTATG